MSMISPPTYPHQHDSDDCTIYRQVSTHQDCAALQEDLTRFARWCQRWQLPLNTGKCKAMCITLKKKPPSFTYSINTFLEWVDTFRYLGVIINNKLKWGDHISAVTVKASRILNLLRRTSKVAAGMLSQEHKLPWYAPSWSILLLSGPLMNRSTLKPWRRCRGGRLDG